MESPPFPRYLVTPRSKYSPQHHVLKGYIVYTNQLDTDKIAVFQDVMQGGFVHK